MFNIYRYISNIACSANGPSILLVNWQLSMWCSINHSLLLAIQSCSCWTPIYGVLIYIYICMAINVNIFGVHLTIHSCCFCLNIYIYIYIQQKAYFSCFRSPFTGELLWLATDAVLQQEHFFFDPQLLKATVAQEFHFVEVGRIWSTETHRETRIKPYKNTISGWWFLILLFSIIYGMSSFPLTNS